MNIEVINHPAQQRHHKTGEPLFNDDGTPVPMCPELKAVSLDGYLVAYVGAVPDRKISFIVPEARLGLAVVEAICQKVASELGGGGDYQAVKEPPEQPTPDDEDDE